MRLELISGTSKKFWEIDLADRSFTARWGRIGTDGQSKQQKFKTAAEAKRAHDKLVAEKVAKGYRDPKVAAVQTSPRNAALEAAIRADRDDPGPTVVYADWLQAQGSAVGELIVLSQGKADAKKKRRSAAIIAGLDLPNDKLATFGWRWGMWQWLRLENLVDWMDNKFDAADLARRLFTQPMAAALDELRIGILRWDFNNQDVPAVLAEAGKHAWAAELRRLHLGDVDDNIDMAHHVIGDVGKLISKTFPGLTSLKLHSGDQSWRDAGETFGIGKLELPELTELTIETCSLSKQRLAHLLAAKLPKLEKLELWFGSGDQGANSKVKDLAPLFAGKAFPKLRVLGLRNCEFADAIATALHGSAIAARLESLDLSMGCLTDHGAAELANGAAAYKKLKSLSVDDNFLTPAGIRQVKAAFKGSTVISKAQKDVDDSVEGEIHRYVSVGE